jgi:hypothetical protein
LSEVLSSLVVPETARDVVPGEGVCNTDAYDRDEAVDGAGEADVAGNVDGAGGVDGAGDVDGTGDVADILGRLWDA